MKIIVILLAIFLNLSLSKASFVEEEKSGLEKKMEKLSISESIIKLDKQIELSNEERFISAFIKRDYDRDLVTRFIRACLSQKKLSQASDIAASTISKLKCPEVYGNLVPSAKRLWQYLQSKDILELEEDLGLKDKNIKKTFNSLSLLDLSNSNIVYEQLGESIFAEGKVSNYISRPHLLSDVIFYLKRIKGTFTRINLANNTLSDEGVKIIVNELSNHEFLEEINLSNNKISDFGLKDLAPLFKLKYLKKIDLSKNYGPSEETLLILKKELVPENEETMKIIIK